MHRVHSTKRLQDLLSCKIMVVALDFDGCMFNREYYRLRKGHDFAAIDDSTYVITANEAFFLDFERIIREKKYSHIKFMWGTNRQNDEMDLFNLVNGHTESCFPALFKLKNHAQTKTKIPCEVIEFLLSHLYGDIKSGKHFKNGRLPDSQKHLKFVPDRAKINLMYAQIHKLASENPHEEIDYYIYDDLDSILNKAHRFFYQNKDLLPRNVTIHMVHYDGQVRNKLKSFKGSRLPDKNYPENVKRMTRIVTGVEDLTQCYNHVYSFYDAFTLPLRLEKFKKERLQSAEEKDMPRGRGVMDSPETPPTPLLDPEERLDFCLSL